VLPRSPTPVPLEERDLDSLTPSELKELVPRNRERENPNVHVKQEIKKEKRKRPAVLELGESSDDDDDLEVSFEGERPKGARTADDSDAEVIDLCSD